LRGTRRDTPLVRDAKRVALEKLLGSKTLDKAFEVQTEFYKSAYEGFVSKATKIGELYADIAKESYKPIEGAVAKATASVKQ